MDDDNLCPVCGADEAHGHALGCSEDLLNHDDPLDDDDDDDGDGW